jgi:excisionase family DNA binding protein
MQTLMTVRELARYLRLSEWAIYQRVARGDLPAKRVGRTIRFDRAEIEAVISKQSQRAPEVIGDCPQRKTRRSFLTSPGKEECDECGSSRSPEDYRRP